MTTIILKSILLSSTLLGSYYFVTVSEENGTWIKTEKVFAYNKNSLKILKCAIFFSGLLVGTYLLKSYNQ
uniref:Uncharacterized protein n=1 Tax=viral metagenome TaxID=1070528 RepID=A0A6C0BES9_9ZZZZ